MKHAPSATIPDVEKRLTQLFGRRGKATACRIEELLSRYAPSIDPAELATGAAAWSEQDVVLITYADQIRGSGGTPLATLTDWLCDEQLNQLINTVHLLPFCPHSSDDGFSVIDYLQVDPTSGNWEDISRLSDSFYLMFDLVLNHISQKSAWFQQYLAGQAPFDQFFIEMDPATDLSAVVRPRSLPLLTPFDTNRGTRHVWTTFSDDQIDLNYAEPEVLLGMLEILLEYARRGARIVRLDAVAFLWKQVGTPCVHLPQTHEIVKLMRDVLNVVAPHVLLLTETNVPHRENVSYFGNGDEAHMVYQFSLPPLLLDAFVNADATPLIEWLKELAPPQSGTTYFNFTASHDGIGVRALEGLVDDQRCERLLEHVRKRGGKISTRRQTDGSDRPYELNISYVDALAPATADVELHAQRFLATQAIMLSLQGVPAVYFQSLIGGQNDYQGVETSGQPRRINRRKVTQEELRNETTALGQRIYTGYREYLACRIQQPAFHPDAPQRPLNAHNSCILAFERTSLDGEQHILVAANVSGAKQRLNLAMAGSEHSTWARDLLTNTPIGDRQSELELAPSQVVWLST